jgi:transcriptional regulator with GAF, ATPase, and Fis domain
MGHTVICKQCKSASVIEHSKETETQFIDTCDHCKSKGNPHIPRNITINFPIANYSTYRHLKTEIVNTFERQFCQHVVGEYANITLAARALCMDRKHLSDLIKKHGVKHGT